MNTAALFDRDYFSRPEYVSGTVRFHNLIRESCRLESEILEIGCGPSNLTSRFLSIIGPVTGIDIERVENDALFAFETFDGHILLFAACSFDVCVSNYVLEHVTDAEMHFPRGRPRSPSRGVISSALRTCGTTSLWDRASYLTLCT
jgi:SAM-dependent methyltransferase